MIGTTGSGISNQLIDMYSIIISMVIFNTVSYTTFIALMKDSRYHDKTVAQVF